MARPAMNMQKVQQCMKGGKSRAACMKEVYPEGASKKPPMKKGGTMPPQFTKKKGK